MKYEFKKIDIDSYELIYTSKNKEEKRLPFKRTIKMAKELNGITMRARINLATKLSEMGLTKDDLIIKTETGNGKTIYNEANYKILEDEAIQEQSLLTTNQIIEDCFNMNIQELFEDMGIDTNESNVSETLANQITLFTQKFLTIVKGGEEEKIPSPESK